MDERTHQSRALTHEELLANWEPILVSKCHWSEATPIPILRAELWLINSQQFKWQAH